MTAREVARRVLDRVDKGAWATLSLDGELARSGLDERDRRLASELVYGVLRNRSRLDHALSAHADLRRTPPRVVTALRVAAYQLVCLDRVPDYAAVDDAVNAARAAGGGKLAGFCNAVLRKLAAAREPALPSDPRARLALAYSLPPWIIDELARAVGADGGVVGGLADSGGLGGLVETTGDGSAGAGRAEDGSAGDGGARDGRAGDGGARDGSAGDGGARDGSASGGDALAARAAAFAQSAPLIARANALRGARDALVAQLTAAGVVATPVAGAPMAIAIDGLGDPSRHATFQAGLWTVQDTGAQRVGIIAAPQPGQRILDACAGVGGKSTHLAELTGGTARIDAADQLPTKLALAGDTARRLGLTGITPIACDLLDPSAPLASAYDLIVLDAPCSGLGVLRRHPDAKWRLRPADVPRLAQLQRRLLDAVVARLAPGGALVYSVCTFTLAEGPAQVAALVERTGLRVVSEHRTWPPGADAFYIARLVRD